MQRKMLITLLLSYLFMLAVPIGVGSVAYFKAERIIEREVTNSNMAMIRQVCDSVDAKLEEIEQMAKQISMNFIVQDFLSTKAPLDETSRYKVTHVIRNLCSYRNSNPFMEDFYIYYKNSDVVITANSMYPSAFFYDHMYSYKNISYEQWRDGILSGYYYRDYMPAMDMLNDTWPQRMITYRQSIPMTEQKEPAGILVVLIDEAKIKHILNNITINGASTYVIDKNNNIVVDAGEIDAALPTYQRLMGREGLIYDRINDQEMAISYITSSHNSWKYVSIIPRAIFMAKVEQVKDTMVVIIAICLMASLLMAYFLALKNYMPIRRIVETLSLWLGRVSQPYGNELDFIRQAMDTVFSKNKQLEQKTAQVLKENQEIKDKINRNKNMIKNGLLLKLIKEKINDLDVMEEWLRDCDINFPYDLFNVVVFRIDSYADEQSNNIKYQWNLVKSIILDVCDKLLVKNYKGFLVELECDMMALLINFSPNVDSSNAIKQIRFVSERIKDIVSKQLGIAMVIGISNLHKGLEGVNVSYREALKALDYRILKGNNCIISFDEIMDEDKGYYYPTDVELQLISSVRIGDIKRSEMLLDYIFTENFRQRRLSLKLVRCLFFDIMSTAIKTLDEIRISSKAIFGENFDPIEELTSCETVEEIYLKIKSMYKCICAYIDEHRISHNIKLKMTIMKYIDQHYMDEGLSQTAMAEQLGITAPYLSRFFKQEFGTNMVDYVNKVRIEKIKTLLADDGLSLSEIAHMVGYGSDKSLIRVFKQYENITPGKYRENLLQYK